MNIRTPFHRRALPALGLLCAVALPKLSAQEPPAAEAAAAAAKTAEAEYDAVLEALAAAAVKFVEAFNKKDAAAVAALFVPLGEIVSSDGITLSGREEIEAYHAELFSGDVVPRIALEATSVQIIAPGVAVEEGFIHLTFSEDEPVSSVGYTATHVKQADGSWLIASSHNEAETTTPAELIKPLHWLIGEWTLEGEDGFRIDLVVDLDGRENFLLGEALITDAEGGAQSTSMRIGWNPATDSIFWWTFDSEGGNASGQWARGDDEWVVHTSGITADGEPSASTQTLLQDGDTMVWNATDRLLAGEAQPDVIYRFVRRAPDPISLIETTEEAEAPAAKPEQD
jgi:uncharacterized protein (TIGR02246 family)